MSEREAGAIIEKSPVRLSSSPDKNEDLRRHLASILILTSIFFVNFLSRIILAPFMPIIESDLKISHADVGSLFLLISIGFSITLLVSGFITSFLTHKRTIILSCLALGLAQLVISRTGGLWDLRLALLFLGMAAGPYVASALTTLTTLVHPKHWGKVLAVHGLGENVSVVIAPVAAEAVLLGFSWRSAFLFLGIAAFFLAGILARFGRGGNFCGDTPRISAMKDLLSKQAFWILVILFSLGIACTMGIFAMLPLYLVTEHGFDRSWANTLLSLSRIAGVGMIMAGGWASDRYGAKKVIRMAFFFAGGLTILIGLASTSWVAITIFLQPVVTAFFFPACLTVLSEMSPPKERSILISLLIPISYMIGGGIIPTLIGWIGDVSSIALGIVLVGVLTLAGALLPGYLKLENQT